MAGTGRGWGHPVITTANQDMLATWLCSRIGYVPSPHMKCIGNVIDGQIAGVVGYDGYNGASVMMHSAGEGNWCTRSMLFAVFHYPFAALKCNMVIGLVPSGNEAAIRFNRHIGFDTAAVLHGAHPDGSLLVMTLSRINCRWLGERYGKEVRSPACA